MLLYAVTDRAWTSRETLRQQVERRAERRRHLRQHLKRSWTTQRPTRPWSFPPLQLAYRFIINDSIEIASRHHADIVERESMAAADVRAKVGPDMIIGVSASVEASGRGPREIIWASARHFHPHQNRCGCPAGGQTEEICDSVDIAGRGHRRHPPKAISSNSKAPARTAWPRERDLQRRGR